MKNEEKNSEILTKMSEPSLFEGKRDESFTEIIKGPLLFGKVDSKYFEILMTEECLQEFGYAFTDTFINKDHNYDKYKQFGLLAMRQSLVYYFTETFPQYKEPGLTTKVLAKMVTDRYYVKIAEKFGFWDYISRPITKESELERNKLTEDVMQAYFGVIERMLNKYVRFGVGYSVVNKILRKIFSEHPFDVNPSTIKDFKTQINEIVQKTKSKSTYNVQKNGNIFTAELIWTFHNGTSRSIGKGSSIDKLEAEQKASEEGITFLKKVRIPM